MRKEVLSEKLTETRGLLAPESYWKLNDDEKYEVTNGCGPERPTGLVPNSILGVDLKPACDIHDYTYAKPSSVRVRKDADDLFLVNMHELMSRNLRSAPMRFLGTIGIGLYYLAVRLLGGHYFN